MKKIEISCPAKVNHNLTIGPIQKNNLHKITTQMQKISLADNLIIEKTENEHAPQITFTLKNPNAFDVPGDETNLVFQAAKKFFSIHPNIQVKITLIKNIPSGAGLGGGSSDAAGVLQGLSMLTPNNTPDIQTIGVSLGSDIPFFLQNTKRAIVSDTGETITPLLELPSRHLIIVQQKKVLISTAWAYQQWDKKGTQIKNGNDFESVIFYEYPEIQQGIQKLKDQGAIQAGLSGSGSAIYGFFSDKKNGEAALSSFDANIYWKWSGTTL